MCGRTAAKVCDSGSWQAPPGCGGHSGAPGDVTGHGWVSGAQQSLLRWAVCGARAWVQPVRGHRCANSKAPPEQVGSPLGAPAVVRVMRGPSSGLGPRAGHPKPRSQELDGPFVIHTCCGLFTLLRPVRCGRGGRAGASRGPLPVCGGRGQSQAPVPGTRSAQAGGRPPSGQWSPRGSAGLCVRVLACVACALCGPYTTERGSWCRGTAAIMPGNPPARGLCCNVSVTAPAGVPTGTAASSCTKRPGPRQLRGQRSPGSALPP